MLMMKRCAAVSLTLSVVWLTACLLAAWATPPARRASAQEQAARPQDSLKNLERAIARLAGLSGGTLGVSAIHVETGRRVSFNGGERFPMASVYKFPIALRLLQRVERGEINLDDTVKLGEFDFRIGHSPIAEMAN